MKYFFKQILKYYLKYITKLVLFIYKPVVIAISGSTNKTFVKDEVKKILKNKNQSVRANPKSFNTEIGLPLAILNLPSGYNSYRNWIPVLKQSFVCIFKAKFPKYLVLELGVSKKGDMQYLLSIIKPKISVITDITQRYLESFSGMDDLVGEYEWLVRKTDKKGLVILNGDNNRAKRLSKKSAAEVALFGMEEGLDWQIRDVAREEKGETFSVLHNGKICGSKINRFGIHHIHAFTIGRIIDENLKMV